MGTHSVRVEIKSGRWKQLMRVKATYKMEPQEFIQWLIDAYPFPFEDACANAGMESQREEDKDDVRIIKV